MRISIVVLMLCVFISVHGNHYPDLELGICVDTTKENTPFMEFLKANVPKFFKSTKFRGYGFTTFYYEDTHTVDLTNGVIPKAVANLHSQPIISAYHGYQFAQLKRTMELQHSNGILLHFAATLKSLHLLTLKDAEKRLIKIYFFVRRCCLKCTKDELRYYDKIREYGHELFCFTTVEDLTNFLRFIEDKSTTSAMIRYGGKNSLRMLLAKKSLTFAIEKIQRVNAKDYLPGLQAGISRVVKSSATNRLNFGVFSKEKIFKYDKPDDVHASFAEVGFLRNHSKFHELLVGRLDASIMLSMNGSVIFSFAELMSKFPNSVIQKADARDIVIHFFMTNCVDIWKFMSQTRKHGIFCLPTKLYETLFKFISLKASSTRLEDYNKLRDKTVYYQFLEIPTVPPTTSTTTSTTTTPTTTSTTPTTTSTTPTTTSTTPTQTTLSKSSTVSTTTKASSTKAAVHKIVKVPILIRDKNASVYYGQRINNLINFYLHHKGTRGGSQPVASGRVQCSTTMLSVSNLLIAMGLAWVLQMYK